MPASESVLLPTRLRHEALAAQLLAALLGNPEVTNHESVKHAAFLANLVERSVTLAQDLLNAVQNQYRLDVPRGGTLLEERALVEVRTIEQALIRCGGNHTRAAKELGISRVALYGKIKKYGL